MEEKNQKTYRVSLTCIYNGYMNVKADNARDALNKAEEMLNCETLSGFPDCVEIPHGEFTFGEATADFIEEEYDNTEDGDNMADHSDTMSVFC